MNLSHMPKLYKGFRERKRENVPELVEDVAADGDGLEVLGDGAEVLEADGADRLLVTAGEVTGGHFLKFSFHLFLYFLAAAGFY